MGTAPFSKITIDLDYRQKYRLYGARRRPKLSCGELVIGVMQVERAKNAICSQYSHVLGIKRVNRLTVVKTNMNMSAAKYLR